MSYEKGIRNPGAQILSKIRGKGRLTGIWTRTKTMGSCLSLRFVTQKSSPPSYLLGIDVESRDLG